MSGINIGKVRPLKATTGAELTEYETERNKAISKVRYIVEQYFGLSHLYNKAYRARFPRMVKMP